MTPLTLCTIKDEYKYAAPHELLLAAPYVFLGELVGGMEGHGVFVSARFGTPVRVGLHINQFRPLTEEEL